MRLIIKYFAMLEIPKTGFKILPIEVSYHDNLNDKDSPSINVKHYCYFKKHESYATNNNFNDNLPADKTLFITNLPVDTTELHLKKLFEEYGKIEKIVFHGIIKENEFLSSVINHEEEMSSNMNEEKKLKKKKKSKKGQRNFKNNDDHHSKDNDEIINLRKLLMTGSSAHIIFQSSNSLSKALNMVQKKRIWNIIYENQEKEAKMKEDFPKLGLSSNIFYK
jgi:ribosomal RNA-processing protein 7